MKEWNTPVVEEIKFSETEYAGQNGNNVDQYWAENGCIGTEMYAS